MDTRSLNNFLKPYEYSDREHRLRFSSQTFNNQPSPQSEPYLSYSSSTACPALGSFSQLSSSRRRSDSDSASQLSSDTTTLSSAPSLPPFPVPPWYQFTRGDMGPVVLNYELPCEFGMLGCYVTFRPEEHEHWIAHSFSHFLRHSPPSKTVCTFCDDPQAYFQDPYDPYGSWRARMLHIGAHHEQHGGAPGNRPDYFLMEHLHQCGLIDEGDFKANMSYTERHDTQVGQVPYKELNLVEDDFQTPEMQARERMNGTLDAGYYDMRSEARHLRHGKDREKGRSGKSYKSSRKADVYQPSRS
ncbi:hypothetical protein WAI453_000434 [Rhynchosporium graminicola]|uniref:Uncharacterized protein n=1 Tax=Rhynchosporium graminicola TaxID=2792576 RepID=A0A1E1JQM4_9HELO|nr:uncharacterized protein RCO7_01009 [Rhynchosporium commune]